MSSFVPTAISQPFFEIQINYKSTKVQKVQKKYISTKVLIIFRATDSRFCMEVHMHCPTKWESTKVQQYKNTKIQKYKKYKNRNEMIQEDSGDGVMFVVDEK